MHIFVVTILHIFVVYELNLTPARKERGDRPHIRLLYGSDTG